MSTNPLEDDPERDLRIRERAYHLWQADGEKPGRDEEYWERARELVGMEDSAGAGQISPGEDIKHRLNGQIIEEAALQENLGEFPGRQTDQGDHQMTPSAAPTSLPAPAPAPAKRSKSAKKA